MLSIIVPVYNEEATVRQLVQTTVQALEAFGRDFELVIVNDGSRDRTEAALAEIAASERRVKVINFYRNHGQTAAMMAGIDAASGEIIVPMDGDLQNDPADIPMLVRKLEEGWDVVSGWRKNRQDNVFLRTLPSRIANKIISKISGVHLHDYGCSLKAYRRDVLEGVRLYGEMHRFIPIYAYWQGAKVTEVVVNHRARQFGSSKYGLERILKVILDLMVVKFLGDFNTKPIYVFGYAGATSLAISILAGLYACYLKFFEGYSFILTPLPLLSAMGFLMAIMFIVMGLLAELQVRTYFESQNKLTYRIRSTLNLEDRR